MTTEAFDLAEKYRLPVIILADAVIGQMMEGVTLPDMQEHDINKLDWTIKGTKNGEPAKYLSNISYRHPGRFEGYGADQRAQVKQFVEEEQRWENVEVADADVVVVAYGCSSRAAKEAVKKARAQGIKLGLIRPKAVVPFPAKAFDEVKADCKGLLDVEMSALGQMVNDVKVASKCKFPVYGYFSVETVPDSDTIVEKAKKILAGEEEEV